MLGFSELRESHRQERFLMKLPNEEGRKDHGFAHGVTGNWSFPILGLVLLLGFSMV